MSTFIVRAKVWKIGKPESARDLDLVVDTGATYTTLPVEFLRELGLEPIRKTKLRMANGRIVQRDLGEAVISIQGRRTVTPVVFGNQKIRLLGAVTLEELSFAANAVARELVPTEAYLLVSQGR